MEIKSAASLRLIKQKAKKGRTHEKRMAHFGDNGPI
jgi:hypothetical protein